MTTIEDVLKIFRRDSKVKTYDVYYSINSDVDYNSNNLKDVCYYYGGLDTILNKEVIDYCVMDKQKYMETVWSNTSHIESEFDELYGEDGQILIFLIKQE